MGEHHKDDETKFGEIIYWILLVLFTGLDCLGIYNVISAYKIGRLKSRSILVFYLSSIMVVTFRVLLFSDVMIPWPWNFYVIGLVTLPTFVYLVTGLSLVMCNFELVIKFRIHELQQNTTQVS